jgi:CRP-like cAMP-binding protein
MRCRLTEEDWNYILQSAKCITYRRNDTIIEEGSRHQRILQIGSGNVRIEKSQGAGEAPLVLGRCGAGSVMGEINFLEGKGATASVIADDKIVDCYVMEGSYINTLIQIRRHFGARFYYYLCSELLDRLRARLSSP